MEVAIGSAEALGNGRSFGLAKSYGATVMLAGLSVPRAMGCDIVRARENFFKTFGLVLWARSCQDWELGLTHVGDDALRAAGRWQGNCFRSCLNWLLALTNLGKEFHMTGKRGNGLR